MPKKKPSRVTAPQVAEIIGCHASTVLNIARANDIGTQHGGVRMFTYADVDALRPLATKTRGKGKRVKPPVVTPSKIATIAVREIADEVGCHTSTVSRVANRLGIGEKTTGGMYFTKADAKKLKSKIRDKPGNPKMDTKAGAKRLGKKGGFIGKRGPRVEKVTE